MRGELLFWLVKTVVWLVRGIAADNIDGQTAIAHASTKKARGAVDSFNRPKV